VLPKQTKKRERKKVASAWHIGTINKIMRPHTPTQDLFLMDKLLITTGGEKKKIFQTPKIKSM
jgi:hypothetical protein